MIARGKESCDSVTTNSDDDEERRTAMGWGRGVWWRSVCSARVCVRCVCGKGTDMATRNTHTHTPTQCTHTTMCT
jgi:hypothetical protein